MGSHARVPHARPVQGGLRDPCELHSRRLFALLERMLLAHCTWMTNFWSMYLPAMLASKSGDSRKRRKNSYTIFKCGHADS